MHAHPQNGFSLQIHRFGIPHRPGGSEKHVHAVITVGGSYQVLPLMAQMQPSLVDACFSMDTDSGMVANLSRFPRRLLLHCNGDFAAVLANRHHCSYLRGDALPDHLVAHDTDDGAAMIRFVASIEFGHNLAVVKSQVRQLLEDRLCGLEGVDPKKLILHLVFSNCGGTGSALAIPTAMLVRDICRTINHTLAVVVIGHCIGPQAYFGRWATPGEQSLGMANAYQTTCELYFAQRPENRVELAQALGLAPPRDLLFNHLLMYDLSGSGDAVQTLEETREHIATNIVGSLYPRLFQHDAGKQINAASTLRMADKNEAGKAILGAQVYAILQLPTSEMANACAGRTVLELLDRTLAAPEDSRVKSLKDKLQAGLELSQTINDIEAGLRDPSFQWASVEHMNDQEVLSRARNLARLWGSVGPARQDERIRDRSSGIERAVTARGKGFVEQLAVKAGSLTEVRSVLQNTIADLENRRHVLDAELENLAGEKAEEVFRRKVQILENGEAGWFGHGRARRDILKSWNRWMHVRSRSAALQLQREQVLIPLLGLLRKSLEIVVQSSAYLAQARRQLESQLSQLETSISFESSYFTRLLAPDEVRPTLARLGAAVVGEFGPAEKLPLPDLLRLNSEGECVRLLEKRGSVLRGQVLSYLDEHVKNVVNFVNAFGLRFDIVSWVRRQLQFTLPCKLNLARIDPADVPLMVSFMAAEAVVDVLQKELVLPAKSCRVEAEDPFAIVLKASVSRAPFRTLPDIAESKRYHDAYLASPSFAKVAPTSHGALKGSNQVNFISGPEALPVRKEAAAGADPSIENTSEPDVPPAILPAAQAEMDDHHAVGGPV